MAACQGRRKTIDHRMGKHTKSDEITLQEALGAYERENGARFHMPGHKGNGLAGFWRPELALWDVTELHNTDNLHAPTGAIARAQDTMAEAYGAKASFFVVNGSTNAVQAMIFTLGENDKLLLSRDCHRSAVNGAALRGIETCYIAPEYDESIGLLGMVTPDALERTLNETNATAVLITSPNAYGFCANLDELAKTAHRHGALLMVDGAHGAHFPFSDQLPHALGGKADLFAHSQHKTMDALTQAASLHLGECRISEEQARRALALTETTSPSYLLMASLDWSVYMAKRRDWTGQVERCIALEQRIEAIEGLRVFHDPIGIGVFERDRTRLVIDVTQRGYTGYEAQRYLEEDGIYLEMADARRLVLITTPNDEAEWYERLILSLAKMELRTTKTEQTKRTSAYPKASRQRLNIRAATFCDTEFVGLAQAPGRTAAEPIGIYPPGIALVMPGEIIQPDAIAYLKEEQQCGGELFGVHDGAVFVTKENEGIHAGKTD